MQRPGAPALLAVLAVGCGDDLESVDLIAVQNSIEDMQALSDAMSTMDAGSG